MSFIRSHVPGPRHRARDDLLIVLRASAVPYGPCCVLGDGIMADAFKLYGLKLEDPGKVKTPQVPLAVLALSHALTCLQHEFTASTVLADWVIPLMPCREH